MLGFCPNERGRGLTLSHFLAVQNSSIGDLVTDSLTQSLTESLLLLPYKEQS